MSAYPTKEHPMTKPNPNILDYWLSVEYFQPQPVPKVEPNKSDSPVFELSADSPPPWHAKHGYSRKPAPRGTVRRFQLYGGILPLDTVREHLEAHFGDDGEVFDERANGDTCLFGITLDENGRPLFDTFLLSSCAWAFGRAFDPGPSSPDWLLGFDEAAEDIAKKFAERFAIRDDDEEGAALREKGIQVGRPITTEDVQEAIDHVRTTLHIETETPESRIRAGHIGAKKGGDSDTFDLLNSFFLKDLARVSGEVTKGHAGVALSSFLTADHDLNVAGRVDVCKDMAAMEELLAPNKFPTGCWPSKGQYPLVFSQQIAINGMWETLSSGSGVFSVNGPPGTGKSTLLRDLIAAIVVERAMLLSKLWDPEQAFQGSRRWTVGEYNRKVSLWKPEFAGFEIVLSSFNNGAVENVTREIPGTDAVDKRWLSDTENPDYFQAIGQAIMQDSPSWAAVAAPLGNKTNRTAFINAFWQNKQGALSSSPKAAEPKEGAECEETEEPGLRAQLKKWEAEPQPDWHAAVQHFLEAVEVEQNFRKDRMRMFENMRRLRECETANYAAHRQQQAAQERHQEVRTAAAASQQSIDDAHSRGKAAKDRLEQHLRGKPGILEIIFTLGSSIRRWRARYIELQQEVDATDKLLASRLARHQEVQSVLADTTAHLQEMTRQADRCMDEWQTVRQRMGEHREIMDKHFPNREAWQDDIPAREKSSPWSDAAWIKARTTVFLRALALHKAFMQVNATIFRQNLLIAKEILDGTAPKNAPSDGIIAAWRTLFFVVPVLSSTFASFDRLFSHLGQDDIGWLLVDEAGQAAPQSTVGAIWRSRRAVIVGDPLQLEPITQVPYTVQKALRTKFQVEDTWTPGKTSAQKLADRVNSYGTYLQDTDGETIWVGSPLRVHRRCDRPMFDISNKTTYGGMMVFGKGDPEDSPLPDSSWIHVDGRDADGHWIPDEGLAVKRLVAKLIEAGARTEDIFLISPFKSVVRKLYAVARNLGIEKVGTIHTVQGKEADIVILVLGGNPQRPGAKQWASSKPNLLNVAVSRAKHRLYVIGHYNDWKRHNHFSTCATHLQKTQYKVPARKADQASGL